jgi:poly(A) polymerase
LRSILEEFVDPKVYTAEQHKIPSEKVDQHAFYVIEKLRQAGHKAYLVGGGVRDLLLNTRPKDFDVSTSASPEEIRSLFRSAILIGRRFRLAHVRFGKKVIEVSTFRAGDIESAELIVRDNQWGTEEEDVLRRDFTINGLFYDPHKEIVIDYVDGYPDIAKRILRTIGQPETRFSQDPVRMIRLIKFSARFNFEIDRPTFEALLSCRREIVKSSSARVFEELFRMLESGAAKPFFHLLQEYGLLAPLLPELAYFLENKEDNDFTLKFLREIDEEIQKSEGPLPDRAILAAALIFPLFDRYLRERTKMDERTLHLGQINTAAFHVIDCIFSSFFKIPRRLRAVMAFILTSQYRFVPLDGKEIRHPRIPNDSLTPLALQLLKIRAAAQPELLSQYTLWTEAAFRAHGENPPADTADSERERPPRRRRRRRPRR